MKGLIIRSPWIDLILSGSKTWEMRTRPTSIRGRIALIKAGSGLIYGTAELTECLHALTFEQMRQTQSFHAIPESQLQSAVESRWTTPWVLRDIDKLESPIPYIHRKGAVTWVELADDILTGNIQQPGKIMKPKESTSIVRTTQLPAAPSRLEPQSQVTAWADIKLTAGNIRNGHIYLRSAVRLLPIDCIGGSNKDQAGASIRVRFEPGMLVESDIAGDKMILRSRAQVRDFFGRTGAMAGDCVRFGRIGDHDFVVTLRRATETST